MARLAVRIGSLGLALSVVVMATSVHAACDLTLTDNTYRGGLDYVDPSAEVRSRIATVESFHFTADVEAIRKGSTGPLPKDIEYTLRHVPNHYRALAAYAQWELREPRQAVSRPRTAECYFQRAIVFRPEDPQLHMLFGVFLHRAGRLDDARKEYGRAEELGLESAELFYNRGLLEFDAGNFEVARKYAAQAYGLGFPFPALRKKLEAKGVPL